MRTNESVIAEIEADETGMNALFSSMAYHYMRHTPECPAITVTGKWQPVGFIMQSVKVEIDCFHCDGYHEATLNTQKLPTLVYHAKQSYKREDESA